MRSLDKQGFDIFPEVFDAETVSSINRSLEESMIPRSRAGMRGAFQIAGVRSLAIDERLMRVAREVLGENALPFRATLFDKSPRSNWLVVWHQDTALPLVERRDVQGWGPWSVKEGVICAHAPASALEQILAARIHLDDADETNGSLRLLPATHNKGVLSDDAIHDLAATVATVDCHVKSGGVLFMRPLVVHSSSKAQTEHAHRRVLHIEYASRRCFDHGLELRIC